MKTLDDNAWQYFSNHLLNDYDFIEQYADDMGVGSDGIVNALLVFNEKTGEGILVNSEGYAYARYSAYLPYAKQTLEYETFRIADYCVTEAVSESTDCSWSVSFDEIYEHYGMVLSKGNGLAEMVAKHIRDMGEVADLEITDDEFSMEIYRECCEKSLSAPKPAKSEYSLLSLLSFTLKDVTFIDKESGRAINLSQEINEKMITPVGRKEWADVLSAKVERIYTEDGKGFIELSGSTERLGDFCYVYDGYGDEEFRKECFRDPRAPQEPMSREYINLDPVDFEIKYAKHILWLNDVPGGERADFSGYALDHFNLTDRTLINAKFQNSKITNSDLCGADLTFADFSGAYFEECGLERISCDEINMRNATVNHCDMTFAMAAHGNFANAHFYKCDLKCARFINSCFENTQFIETDHASAITMDDCVTDEEWCEERYGEDMSPEMEVQ